MFRVPRQCVACTNTKMWGHFDPTNYAWYCEECWQKHSGNARVCGHCIMLQENGKVDLKDDLFYCSACQESYKQGLALSEQSSKDTSVQGTGIAAPPHGNCRGFEAICKSWRAAGYYIATANISSPLTCLAPSRVRRVLGSAPMRWLSCERTVIPPANNA